MISQEDYLDPRNFRSVKEPSRDMKEYYAKYYKRNQNKFMRRSKLEESHLGTQFEFDGKILELLGSVDPVLMFVKDINSEKFYFIHSDIVTEKILNKV